MWEDPGFDPYLTWLGIDPEDQPAHHYRLLGIRPFESDSNVIANAARRRMGQVKRFEAVEHRELSHRILKEIAAARNCLLAPDSKADYDRILKARLGEQAATWTAAPQAGA